MRDKRNPFEQRALDLPQQRHSGGMLPVDALRTGWKLTLLAGTALALMCAEGIAGEQRAGDIFVDTQLAQSKDEEQTEANMIILAPISIDAKADVITGGVQLDAQDLDRIDPQTMRDVFRQEPGVTVSSPISISQQIHVNGIEDTNLNVDIDGARQANKTYHHLGTTLTDPGMFKAVKVETGVAPADAGPNALAGTISLETKDGRDFVDPGETFGGFIKASYNTNTEGFTEQGTIASRVGNFDVMAYGSFADGRGYEDGEGDYVTGSDPAARNLLFKLGHTADNGYRVKLTANHYDDIGVRPPRPDFGFTGGDLAPVEYRRQNYAVSFGDQTPTDMWDPKATLAYTNTRVESLTTLNAFNATAHVKADIQTFNGKASNTFTTDYGKITGGADFFKDTGKGGRNGFVATEKAYNTGVFAQARTSWTGRFRTSIGARYDFSRLEGHDDASVSDSGASGNANVEYDVTDELMGYAGISTTFGGYQLGEIGLFNSVNNYDTIEPSRSFNYKAGAVYEVGSFTLDGNVYLTRINNAHDLGQSDRGANRTIHSRGFNVSAKYNYEDGFVSAGFASNNLRINGAYLENRSADYYGTDTGDSFNLEIFHMLRQYNMSVGTTNEFMLPDESQTGITGSGLDGYVVTNVHAEWMPEQLPGMSLRFDIVNLFDRTYTDRSNVSIVESSGTTGVTTPFNEPGRSFILTAKYDF